MKGLVRASFLLSCWVAYPTNGAVLPHAARDAEAMHPRHGLVVRDGCPVIPVVGAPFAGRQKLPVFRDHRGLSRRVELGDLQMVLALRSARSHGGDCEEEKGERDENHDPSLPPMSR